MSNHFFVHIWRKKLIFCYIIRFWRWKMGSEVVSQRRKLWGKCFILYILILKIYIESCILWCACPYVEKIALCMWLEHLLPTIWYCVLYESVWNLGNEHQRKTIQRPCWRERKPFLRKDIHSGDIFGRLLGRNLQYIVQFYLLHIIVCVRVCFV